MGFDITLETDKLPKPKDVNLEKDSDNKTDSVEETDVPSNVKQTTSMEKAAAKAPQATTNTTPFEKYPQSFNSMPNVGNSSKSFGEEADIESGMETDKSEKDLTATWEKSKAKNKAVVEAAIAKSLNVVAALEGVASEYKVAPSHIMVDNSLKSIKVQEDMIIAPESKNVQGNKENIVRAIATLLDNIGCRIDKKFDDYQMNCIAQNKELERQQMLDAQNRPTFDSSPSKVYFNDQDDIAAGVSETNDTPNQSFGSDTSISTDGPEPKSFGTGISPEAPEPQSFGNGDSPEPVEPKSFGSKDDVEEACENIAMEALYDAYGTPYIGTALFSAMGYNVEKTSVVQEATTNGSSGITPDDIKYMRFDNSGIVKAVKCFNEMRKNQSEVKEDNSLDYRKIVNDPKFKEGIDALSEQFDCVLKLTLENTDEMVGYTMVDRYTNPRHKVTISKKSGFKLNGYKIYVNISMGLFKFVSPKDESLFGQMLVSVLLHEIFHNITTLLMWDNAAWIGAYMVTITRAIQTKSPKVKKILIQKYIEYTENMAGRKMNKIKKIALQKQLFALCSAKEIQKSFDDSKKIRKAVESTSVSSANNDPASGNAAAEELIKKLNEVIPDLKNQYKTKPGKVAEAIMSWVGAAFITAAAFFAPFNAPGVLALGILLSVGFATIKTFEAALPAMLRQMAKQFKSGKDLEEQFADAFAAMYKLPVIFHFVPGEDFTQKYKFNDLSYENLDKLVKLFQEFGVLIMDPHPTDYQRASQAIKAAKQILDEGGKYIDPAQKKYLQWLVNGFDSIEDTSVDDVNPGESPVFDPNATADLNKHLDNLIQHGRKNINITESFNFNDLMDKRMNIITESDSE